MLESEQRSISDVNVEITGISLDWGSHLCFSLSCSPALCSPVSCRQLLLLRGNPQAAAPCVSAGDLSQRPGFYLGSLLTCSELLALPSTSAHNFCFSSLVSFVLLNETLKEKTPLSSPSSSIGKAVPLVLIPAPPGRGSWCWE